MAAESSFSVLEPFPNDVDQDRQQREAIERRREFATLVPFWFDELQDFYHSDSDQSADARLLPPRFSVDYGEVDADDFADAPDLDDNVVVDVDSVGNGSVFGRENQVNFVRDLLQDRLEDLETGRSDLVMCEGLSGSDLGVVDDSNHFDLRLEWLGLGLNFRNEGTMIREIDEEGDDSYFGSWRINGGESVRVFRSRLGSEEDDPDVSNLCSEEEDEFGLEYANTIDDVSENLCWDSLQLEDQMEAGDEELEWEEVGDGAEEVEELERGVLSMALGGEVDDVIESVFQLQSDEVVPERVMTGWEVLLHTENVGGGHVELGNDEDVEGYFNADEYETVFGQFADNETGLMGKPPASKAYVENLETVIVMQVDEENDNSRCAVCKDDMHVGEKAKRLPCLHSYHGDCIIPWLGIRNTCPVCRFELPTDDPAYERRRTERASGGN